MLGLMSRESWGWIGVLGATTALLALGNPGHARGDHPVEPQAVEGLEVKRAAEPPLEPVPRADCGPGSRPETGMQGRVSPEDHESGRAANGFTCNTRLVGAYRKPNALGTVGGFKVERYVDAAGHECAYY